MKIASASARVAFVVHIEKPETAPADIARVQHVVHLFRGQRVPATWSIAGQESLELMQHKGLFQAGDELAISISSKESTNVGTLRDAIRNRLATIHACTGSSVNLAAGEVNLLRNHAAILAEQGLRGIISNRLKRRGAIPHSPLPCGLWQLDYAIAVPNKSWLSRLLPGTSALHQLKKLSSKEHTILVTVDTAQVAHASTRSLQSLENLLRQVSLSASRDELTITTAGEIVAELTASRMARPQQSILRAA